jgi:hypothetical protein
LTFDAVTYAVPNFAERTDRGASRQFLTNRTCRLVNNDRESMNGGCRDLLGWSLALVGCRFPTLPKQPLPAAAALIMLAEISGDWWNSWRGGIDNGREQQKFA